ncbi:MAG: TonB-dependent receptor plug domain-containing protein [Bacteroidota bacterium]
MKVPGLLLLALLSTPAAADVIDSLTDLPFEDLPRLEVSSPSKFLQSSQLAPSAVQVIEAEDIRRHGWRKLSEALDSLPGLYSVGDRAYDFVGARGFLVPGDYNTRFLLLLDGQRLNDNVYGQAAFGDDFQLDLALVERIEYVPGPASSIYGSNALFGVINVITRRAGSLPGLETGLRVSSDGWREMRITGSRLGGDGGPALVASLTHGEKGGRDLAYPGAAGLPTADGSPSPDGVSHGLDRSTLTRAYVSLTEGGFSSAAWAARREVQPSSALYGTNFNDDRLRLVDASYGIRASYRAALAEDWKLESRLAWQKMTYRADYPFFDATAGAYLNRDDTVGTWWSGEMRLLYLGYTGHKLMSGVEFNDDQQAIQKNFDVGVSVNPPVNVDTRGHWLGYFIQDEWHFAPAWHLNAGLRHDRHSTGHAYTSPRLGLIWQADERTTFKLLAGNAYRVANAYETAYGNNTDTLASPGLKPEKSRSREAVGELRLTGNRLLGASLYDYRMSNLIRQVEVAGGALQYQNQPEVSGRGLELYFQQRQAAGLSLFASLTLNRTRDADDQQLANSPRWIAKLRASHPLLGDRLLAALEMNAIGPRLVARPASGGNQVASQWLVNATLTATRLAPGLTLQLRALNLFDRRYGEPGSNETPVTTLPMTGRQWQLGLAYAF